MLSISGFLPKVFIWADSFHWNQNHVFKKCQFYLIVCPLFRLDDVVQQCALARTPSSLVSRQIVKHHDVAKPSRENFGGFSWRIDPRHGGQGIG